MATVRTRCDFQYFIIFSNMMLKFRHSSMGANAEEMVDMDQDR
jgi:hypothetical protein